MDEVFIDAMNKVAGRLASLAAKESLKGKSVYIFNAEKAIITGNPKYILEHYKDKISRGDPYKGPFYPRPPDKMLRRMIRGMLPYKKPRGREAYKRVKVFISVPKEYSEKTFTKFEELDREPKTRRITLGQLSLMTGAKKTW
ncbi:MAG: 50S ribosomal protein L13 [Candidatus Aenigmatarchaeota archaeon]|nr:MAG: 50S ribosomal protein L13 [Candidatus Aenigmarchaeota archaeon]